jgi:cytochrome c-type biogenesis protein
MFTDGLVARLKTVGRIGRILQVVAAGIMILMGIAMITGQLSRFAFWLLETFPILAEIG